MSRITGTDEISEKDHRRIHLLSFTFIVLVIGVILFWVVQVLGRYCVDSIIIKDKPNPAETQQTTAVDSYLGHDYCGTFYIWLTIENNYQSPEAWQASIDRLPFHMDNPLGIADNCITTLSPMILFLGITMALRRADQQLFFTRRSWRLLFAAGIASLISSIWKVFCDLYRMHLEQPFVTGIFENRRYYCQLYHQFGIPALILITALLMRQHTLYRHGQDTHRNAILLRIMAVLTGAAAGGFMLMRYAVRVYEIFTCRTRDAMLPFYSELLPLPRSFADSPEAYRNLLLLRLVKDLPVGISAGITVVLLICIIRSAASGAVNTVQNKQRLRIAMAALCISSVILNLLGLAEVHLLNAHFTSAYSPAVYTIAIRSLCEPALYVVLLWFMGTFLSICGKETAKTA